MDCDILFVLMLAVLTSKTCAESGNITQYAYTPNTSTPQSSSYAPALAPKPNPVVLPSAVGRIKVKWMKATPCQGYVYFSVNLTQGEEYLCFNEDILGYLGPELCEERRCGKFIGFKNSDGHGYMIHKNLTATEDTKCKTTFLTCEDFHNNELRVYKAITGLLLTLIIGVFLCRFGQPMYTAIRKRFSQKRQNRWIGPTQSQSVCYHRGQASNPNNNTMKRQSYPGLERLTVNPSREPSSNRNSDYDSYGS